jgi:hypothetical protein
VTITLCGTTLVRDVPPLEAFYEQSGFVPSKVEPPPVGFVQCRAFSVAGILVMAHGSDVVHDFRRVAVPSAQYAVGQ